MITDLITVREAARMLSMSGKNVLKLCKAGKLSYHQDGRWLRIPRDSIRLYMHNTYFEQKNPAPRATGGTVATPKK